LTTDDSVGPDVLACLLQQDGVVKAHAIEL
jgi:hypothetical protein